MRYLPLLLLLAACDPSAIFGDDSSDKTEDSSGNCPVAVIDHTALTWTDIEVGSSSEQVLLLQNTCEGEGDLAVSSELSGTDFKLDSSGWALAPNEAAVIRVTYSPSDGIADAGTLLLSTTDADRPEIAISLSGIPMADEDNDGSPADEDCDDGDASVYPGAPDEPYDGVDSNCDAWSDYDQDRDGSEAEAYGGDDCDDENAAIYPGAAEVPYDGIDADCYGSSDYDADVDGFDSTDYGGTDCDDADAYTFPGAPDAAYDGVDSDCAGDDDYDADGDGQSTVLAGGTDCDDGNASTYLGAPDVPYDGTDADCSGSDYDSDVDGYESAAYGGDDCDDADPLIFPGAAEVWYDGVDTDCNGASDYDKDADGYDSTAFGGTDCNDADASVSPGATDTWYDGVDSDCGGNDDYDRDYDHDADDDYTGTDCDESDPTVYGGAYDIWYDGVDSDCAGDSDYDQDADGQDAEAYGGDDCDDTEGSVYLGAPEVWYDGTDGDCAGDDDYDQDRDGYQVFPTGDDCDDTDASTTLGGTELENGLDDDCDGLVDEDFVDPGDVVITEVMSNPNAVSDTAGEWFELYNASTNLVDLNGWIVYSDDGSSFTVSGSLPISPGEYAVLGVESDSALNGGVTLDYEYARSSFSFSDSDDSIYLVSGSTTVAELAFTSATGWPSTAGYAFMLDDDHFGTSDSATRGYWCAAREVMSAGDRGTPGESGGNCYIDDDGDGANYSDCDDDDPDRGYLSTETSNGIDDDCNGFIDESVFAATDVPYLTGGSYSAYLNYAGWADFDGDGTGELLAYQEGADTAYFLPTSSYSSWAGSASGYDERYFTTASSAQSIQTVPANQSDLDGDGSTDVVYANSASGGPGFSVFYGPFTATTTGESADSRFSKSESASATQLDVSGDFDGDGVSELVYGNQSSNNDGYSGSGAIAIFAGGTTLASAINYTSADLVFGGGASSRSLGSGIAVSDVDNDGVDDLVASAPGATSVYLWLSDGLSSSGTQTMSTVANATLSGLSPNSIGLDDADGDGSIDLMLVRNITAEWYLDLGSYSGSATASADSVYNPEDFGLTYWYSLSISRVRYDADADGDEELMIYGTNFFSDPVCTFFGADAFGSAEVSPANAALTFTVASMNQTRGVAADLDADGDEELLLGDYSATAGGYGSAGAIWVFSP